jgi:hypothetical protein
VEVQTQSPSGTKLRIDADRTFEGQTGDGVLRIQGEGHDGGPVFDAAYTEVDPREADTVAKLLRATQQSPQEMKDRIAQEVQATFGSRLGGRDAHQIAEIVGQTWWQQCAAWLGVPTSEAAEKVERLAERFERTAAKRANPAAFSGAGSPN